MEAEVDRAAIWVRPFFSEGSHQTGVLRRIQFWGQEEQPCASATDMAAHPGVISCMPKGGPVMGPSHVGAIGQLLWHIHGLVYNVAAIGIMMHFARALITNASNRAMGGRLRGTSTLAAGYVF